MSSCNTFKSPEEQEFNRISWVCKTQGVKLQMIRNIKRDIQFLETKKMLDDLVKDTEHIFETELR